VAGSAAGLDATSERHEFASPHMGTQARIVVYADDSARAEAAAQAAFVRIAELDQRLSDYRDTSEVSALARAAGGAPLAVSPDVVAVLEAAQDTARWSEGAFDVTCGPLSRLWRRAGRTSVLPDPTEIAEARALVGFSRLELDPAAGTACLAAPGMRLDLGAIAKGYAADEALRTLRRLGLDAALVELGTTLTGMVLPEVSRSTQRRSCVEGFKKAAETLAGSELALVVEPLNHIDHPGFFMTRADHLAEVIAQVSSRTCGCFATSTTCR
jgi:thiamine biosynthesis lipoprotein ApbE